MLSLRALFLCGVAGGMRFCGQLLCEKRNARENHGRTRSRPQRDANYWRDLNSRPTSGLRSRFWCLCGAEGGRSVCN
jgi:hypothetical protein